MNKVLNWTCPKCGKEISSIYERQFAQNKKAHIATHEENPSIQSKRKETEK